MQIPSVAAEGLHAKRRGLYPFLWVTTRPVSAAEYSRYRSLFVHHDKRRQSEGIRQGSRRSVAKPQTRQRSAMMPGVSPMLQSWRSTCSKLVTVIRRASGR